MQTISNDSQFITLPNNICLATERRTLPCADSGIFVKGDPGQSDKKALTTVFFLFVFLRPQLMTTFFVCFSPQLILQMSNC